MLFLVGVEVTSGALEIRRFALGVLMDVDAMFAGRKSFRSSLIMTKPFSCLRTAVPASAPCAVFKVTVTGAGPLA